VTTGERIDGPTVRLSEQAITLAERHAIEAAPNELGGILVGWWEGRDTAVVQELLLVPDYQAGRSHYERGHSHAQAILDAYVRSGDDPRLGYIGEWHSHPAPQPPSSVDRSALAAIVRQAHSPVALVVLALISDHEVVSHALIGRPRWPRRAAIEQAATERMTP